MFCRSIFILFLSVLCIASYSQTYQFKSYDIEEVHSFNYLSSIFQDQKGYIWLGLNGGGLAKFDGAEFKLIDEKSGLINNRVTSISDASNSGQLIIGTTMGLSIMSKDKVFKDLENTIYSNLSNIRIFSISSDKSGNTFLGTESGIYQIYYDDDNEKYEIVQALENIEVYCVYIDKDNNKWIGTSTGLYKFERNVIRPTWLNKEVDLNIKCMVKDNSNILWIGSYDGGLYKYYKGKLSKVSKKADFIDTKVNAIVKDHSGNIWIGTNDKGLCRTDGTDFTFFNVKNGLKNNTIYSLYVDHESNIWFGTGDQGICVFRGEQFVNYNINSGLNSNFILSILQDQKGNYWFGSDDGLCKLEGDKFIDFKDKNGFTADRVNSILEDKNGNMWFLTNDMGIIKFNQKSFVTYNRSKGINGRSFLCSYMDNSGDLWFGTFGYGLFKYSKGVFSHLLTGKGQMNNIISSINQLDDGRLLFGTDRGLLEYNGKSFKKFYDHSSLNFPIWGIKQDADAYIWLATYGNGVIRLHPNAKENNDIKVINEKQGLRSDLISGIELDNRQDIWITTDREVMKFNVKEYNETSDLQISFFGKREGFDGKECNARSVYKDNKGNIWFGTISGAIKYDSKSSSIKEEPRTFITQIKLHNKTPNWSLYSDSISTKTGLPENLTLPHHQNYITFGFVNLSYKNPEGLRYEYKMSGEINEEWKSDDNASATYPSLLPGKYAFSVRACNSNNVCNEPVTYSFVIKKPFYKRLDFIFTMFIITIGVAFSLYKYRVKVLEQDRQKLKLLVAEQTKDLNDSIKYAQKIQVAVSPLISELEDKVPDSFILFKPKDLVSGDFYWFTSLGDELLVAAVDCTGHGVPGAFMSMIGNILLNEIVINEEITTPSKVLTELNERIIKALKQDSKSVKAKDGMDLGFIKLNLNTNKIEYSGANRPLYLIRNNELNIKTGDHFPIGSFYDGKKTFNNHEIQLEKGDKFYLTTDGYADQFGGEKKKKFMTKRFKNLLVEISDIDIKSQKSHLNKVFEDWRMGEEQVDDVLIIGIQIA